LEELNRRTGIRRNLVAFSPETQQLVINLGDQFFCTLRKTNRLEDAVVCLFNLTNKPQEVLLPTGLMEFCRDVISYVIVDPEKVELKPYQCLWLRTRFVI